MPDLFGLLRSRYFFLSMVLFVLLLGCLLAGIAGEDYWEHSAVVRELATNPWDPRHPLLRIDATHAFFSPYLLTVGLMARLFSLDSLQALFFAGLFNFVLFAAGLRFFVAGLFREHTDQISFYSLLFILFFWPTWGAGMWSGFYHFKVLPYTLPYPSTFSMAVTFFVLGLYQRALLNTRWTAYLPPLLLTTVVIITHPTTALFTFVGLGAISLQQAVTGHFRAILIGSGIVVGSLILTAAWPYYSFFGLIQANNPEFHVWSKHLYERQLLRLFSLPIAFLLALPVIVQRLRSNGADALVLMMLGALVVYVLAPVVGVEGAGRILSQVAVTLQILLGAAVFGFETRVRQGDRRYLLPLGGVAVLTVAMNTVHYVDIRQSLSAGLSAGNVPTFREAFAGLAGKREKYADWRFLTDKVPQYDVVLADLNTSWKQMTFGGKSVAAIHPVHWIDDGIQRRAAVTEFFARETGRTARLDILKRYCPDYILLHVERGADNMPYYEFGRRVAANNTFILLEVDVALTEGRCETGRP